MSWIKEARAKGTSLADAETETIRARAAFERERRENPPSASETMQFIQPVAEVLQVYAQDLAGEEGGFTVQFDELKFFPLRTLKGDEVSDIDFSDYTFWRNVPEDESSEKQLAAGVRWIAKRNLAPGKTEEIEIRISPAVSRPKSAQLGAVVVEFTARSPYYAEDYIRVARQRFSLKEMKYEGEPERFFERHLGGSITIFQELVRALEIAQMVATRQAT